MRTNLELALLGSLGTVIAEGASYGIYKFGYSKGFKDASLNKTERIRDTRDIDTYLDILDIIANRSETDVYKLERIRNYVLSKIYK